MKDSQCFKCNAVLVEVRYTIKGDDREWCSTECRNGEFEKKQLQARRQKVSEPKSAQQSLGL